MRILLISYHFPPYNCIGAVRTGKMAKYLAIHGHQVRVLTATNQPLPRSLSVEIPLEWVTYTRWWDLGVASTLARSYFGAGAGKESRGRRLRDRLRKGLRRAYHLTYRALLFPDPRIGWYPFAVSAGNRLLQDWPCDVVYASSGPITSLLVARALAQRHRLPWVAELRDLWVDNPSHSMIYPRWRRLTDRIAERRLLSRATGIVAVSEPMAEVLRAKYTRPIEVVPNGFDPSDYPTVRRYPTDSHLLRIVYTGNVYERGQELPPLLAALRLMDSAAERVRLVFYGRNLQSVRGLAAQHGVSQRVETHDVVPHREALQLQTEADILLLLLWDDPQERSFFPAKVYEYLGAQRPILAVGKHMNSAAQLVIQRGAGVFLNQAEQIAGYLKAQLEQKRRHGEVPFLPSYDNTDMTRESQAQKLAAYLRKIQRSRA